jgi:FAD/FMN-containing dehydrogenase
MNNGMRSGIDYDRLRTRLQGDVVLPRDVGYGHAKQLQDVRFDAVSPRAVVFCESTADVRETLRFARRHDLHLAVRSGGHSVAGYSTTSGLVLDVSRLDSATVHKGIVRVGPGLQAVDAVNALAPHGLAVPNGFCPTVSAGGFFAGGGIGLLTRSHGVGSDRVRGAEVVLADGRVVRCSRHEDEDLFWALRGGGGGNFGVVTAYDIEPVPVTGVVNFSLVWSWDDAADVVSAWQRWAPAADRGLTSWLGIFLPDAAPGAVAQVVAFGMWQGDPAALDGQLAALTSRVPAAPLVRSVEPLPYQTAMMQWWFCGGMTVDQCHRTGDGGGLLPRTPFQTLRGRMFDRPMPRQAVERFLAAFDADRRPGQSRVSLAAAFGGAANEPGRRDTAYVHRDSLFHLDYTITVTTPAPSREDLARSRRWADKGFDAIDPHSNHESYQNYTDPRLRDWARAYYAENYERLTRVKRRYDPDNVFRFEQSIGSGTGNGTGHGTEAGALDELAVAD